MIKSSSGHKKNNKKNALPAIVSLAGLVLSVITLVTLLILFLVSGSSGSSNPIVLIYGSSEEFSSTILSNTLHSAGFDYEFVSDKAAYDDAGNFKIPSRFEGEEIILMTMGDKAFDSIAAYKNAFPGNEGDYNVLGFVMLCPKFPGNLVMEGINSTYPAKNIAIFTGRDETTDITNLSDGRLIYERLSGDDTLYGASVTRGNIYPSKCFMSLNQNRYLSISSLNYRDGMAMVKSPLFQIELSAFLSSVYSEQAGTEISFNRIISFVVLSYGCMCLFWAGMGIYFIGIAAGTVKRRKVVSGDNSNDRVYHIVSAVVSVLYAVIITAVGIIPQTRKFYLYAILAIPVVFLLATSLSAVGTVSSASSKKSAKPGQGVLVKSVMLGLMEVFYVALVTLLIGNFTVKYSYFLPVALVTAVIDAAVMAMSSYADRLGAKTMFTSKSAVLWLLIPMVLPSAVMTIMKINNFIPMLWCVIITAIPYLMILPMKRHSDNALIQGITHALIYLILLLWIG